MENKVKVNNVQQSIDTEEREALFNKRRAYGCESEYAENRKQWRENPENNTVAEYPLHVDIELSSICNLHCPMCYTITEDFRKRIKPGFIDFKLFKTIVDECAANDVYSIRLSLRGESTLHKLFVDCIRYAKESGIKEVSTLTNGKNFIDKSLTEQIIDAGIDWITVSIDGIESVYESIRWPIKFEDIKTAMGNLMDIRRDKIKPAIKIQGLWPAIKENPDKYIEIFTPLSDLLYTNPLIDYLHNDDIEEIEYIPEFTCYQPFQRLVINSNGKALMCANDQVDTEIIGDAYKMSIHEIWHGNKMENVRRNHITHMAIDKYRTCKMCQVPRAREYEKALITGKIIYIENYKGRAQNIGK
ncbi:Radical SAM domain protein [Candidatus Magnetobacterium bavaricum]|uniref:Radical SAM domain protein n=1 Tax=Candidatus Magnetobacterium bavaricum TaxID=29290 RepID=A0A0F3GJD8_9BACT|nr:Radical SAM domain protein [Candidatus Magnetobacterium bavaricum]